MIAIDTNILVYAVQDRAAETGKQERARGILLEAMQTAGIVPIQVLGEFLAVIGRKVPDREEEARRAIANIAATCATPPTTIDALLAAQTLAARYRLQYFDALIVAVAASAGADILYSEDMQHGLVAGDMKVVNPFL